MSHDVADRGVHLPCVLRVTTDFAYVRMHGPDHHQLYAGSYSDADLQWWADRIREWSRAGQDVYVYFNNDGNANAVRNARTLQALLAPDAGLPVLSEPGPGLRTRGLADCGDEPDDLARCSLADGHGAGATQRARGFHVVDGATV